MDSKKYEDDLSEIRNMMSRSSRFMSLSGLSGILAGVYALLGAWLVHARINRFNRGEYADLEGSNPLAMEADLVREIATIGGVVMGLALLTAVLLSYWKTRNSGEKLWTPSSRRLLFNFFIPLGTGGLFCLVLLQYGFASLIAPTTLIFYGLSCLNASKYTLGDIRRLGLANIFLGLLATQFIGYGLLFWAMGFGLLHIVYGSLMYFKYER
jgi:hypothetical protein